MDDNNITKNNDLIGRKKSLFPELSTHTVYIPPPKSEPEVEPAPKPLAQIFDPRTQLSSQFDQPVPDVPQKTTEPVLGHEPTLDVPLVHDPLQSPIQTDDVHNTRAEASKTLDKESTADDQPAPHRSHKVTYMSAALVVAISALGVGGYLLLRPKDTPVVPAQKQVAVSSKIAVYRPTGLPTGYTYNNDLKETQANVFTYTVSGPNKQMFYVTQQAAPSSSDFVNFNKRISNPVTLDTEAGTTIAGKAGVTFISSTTTPKNTWIIINAPASTTVDSVQAVVRSLAL
ncbi:hypothetical protein BH10PAT3_BH10PAT3_4350 [soil metagenome]